MLKGRGALLALGAAAIVMIAYGFFWRAGAKQMQRSIAGWTEEQRAAGIYADYGSVRVEGFPFLWRGVVLDAIVGGAEARSWRANTLRIDASPFSPNSLAFSAPHGETLNLGDGGRWKIAASHGKAKIASLANGRWMLDVKSGEATAMRADADARAKIGALTFSLQPAADDPARLAARLSLDDASVAVGSANANLENLEADLDLTAAPALAEGIAAWRASGGELRIARFTLKTEEATLTARGAVTLDMQGYPSGVLEADVVNPGGLAVFLDKIDALSPEDAKKAQASLSLAAIASGGKLSGLLVLKNGEISFAGVRLARLARVEVAP